METHRSDARAVVEELRAEVAQWASNLLRRSGPRAEAPPAGADLAYLHGHWDLSSSLEVARRPGGGWRGVARRAAGRLAAAGLRRYISDESELLAHAVRAIDALDCRSGELAAAQEQLLATTRAELVELASRLDARLAELAELLGGGAAGSDTLGTDPPGEDG